MIKQGFLLLPGNKFVKNLNTKKLHWGGGGKNFKQN